MFGVHCIYVQVNYVFVGLDGGLIVACLWRAIIWTIGDLNSIRRYRTYFDGVFIWNSNLIRLGNVNPIVLASMC